MFLFETFLHDFYKKISKEELDFQEKYLANISQKLYNRILNSSQIIEKLAHFSFTRKTLLYPNDLIYFMNFNINAFYCPTVICNKT